MAPSENCKKTYPEKTQRANEKASRIICPDQGRLSTATLECLHYDWSKKRNFGSKEHKNLSIYGRPLTVSWRQNAANEYLGGLFEKKNKEFSIFAAFWGVK